MSRENVDAARRSLDAWNRGDADAWLDSAHSDIEFFSAVAGRMEGSETVFRGTAEMRRFWDESHLVWDLAIDISELRDLGNTVLVLGRIRTRGEASGVDLEGPVAYVFEFEGGLARRVRAYLDHQQALDALGLRD
jgi:ketosteroid isomerase-like protein